MRAAAYWGRPDWQMNIEKNFERLSGSNYDINHVFRASGYGWPGDWEGRALLAFVCHYHISGRRIPCMDEMMDQLQERTNRHMFFGPESDGQIADEQQLSGNSWYLRGLMEYASAFDSGKALEAAASTFENLYERILPLYDRYPLERGEGGGVSGEVAGTVNGWRLSTDVGCAFMCVDGVSHYYSVTRDKRAGAFLRKVTDVFAGIDIVKYRFQTHTSLTCMRGILRLYETDGDTAYLELVRKLFDRYIDEAMTLTYENYNWFGRPHSWTEPCAVVDSLILAVWLHGLTGEDRYRTLARRIWMNGLQFCQRENGGAGPNSCAIPETPVLEVHMYEADFCCTMRYAEGLRCYAQSKALFDWDPEAPETVDEYGRRFVDDRLLVMDEKGVRPIFSCNTVPAGEAKKLRLKVLY